MHVKFSKSRTVVRHLFYKAHKVRQSLNEKPVDRTLFIINVPAYCDENCLKRLFSECGEVVEVHFSKGPSSKPPSAKKSKYFPSAEAVMGTKVAYLVFKSSSALQAALKMSLETPRILSTKVAPIVTGIQKWRKEYNSSIVNESELHAEINTFMTEYDAKIAQKSEEEKEKTGVADEEGWIKVTKYGRTPGIPRTEANEIKTEQTEKKKRRKKELQNFYTFQIKESKMEHIAQLRQKFEEDKNRIELLKAARKFRPH